jgi:hypothetical protein
MSGLFNIAGRTYAYDCAGSKHMDGHQRPYVCQHPGCPRAVRGYVMLVSLLHHAEKFHGGQGK